MEDSKRIKNKTFMITDDMLKNHSLGKPEVKLEIRAMLVNVVAIVSLHQLAWSLLHSIIGIII